MSQILVSALTYVPPEPVAPYKPTAEELQLLKDKIVEYLEANPTREHDAVDLVQRIKIKIKKQRAIDVAGFYIRQCITELAEAELIRVQVIDNG